MISGHDVRLPCSTLSTASTRSGLQGGPGGKTIIIEVVVAGAVCYVESTTEVIQDGPYRTVSVLTAARWAVGAWKHGVLSPLVHCFQPSQPKVMALLLGQLKKVMMWSNRILLSSGSSAKLR